MDTTRQIDLRGLWVPIITPFEPAGQVDEHALARLSARLLDDGVAGLVALGTTGEPATLSADERRRVVHVCSAVSSAAGCPLIVGAGTNSTAGTLDEIALLCGAGVVDAALIVVPYYTRPSEPAIVEHFQIVADESPVPILIYNIPYRTGRGLGAEAVLELASHPNIVGMKQAVGCLDRDTLEILRRRVDDFAVLAGDDAFICPTLLMGGRGAIAAAAHLCTPAFVEMVAAASAGDVDGATRFAELLLPVVDAGFSEPSPAVWKGALRRLGEIPTGQLRRPMTAASTGSVDDIMGHVVACETATKRTAAQ